MVCIMDSEQYSSLFLKYCSALSLVSTIKLLPPNKNTPDRKIIQIEIMATFLTLTNKSLTWRTFIGQIKLYYMFYFADKDF